MSRRAQPRGARARSPRSGRVRVVERHATGTGQIAATPVCPNLFVALEAPTPPTRRTARAFADAARARPWPHPVATWAAPFRFPLRASRAPGSSCSLPEHDYQGHDCPLGASVHPATAQRRAGRREARRKAIITRRIRAVLCRSLCGETSSFPTVTSREVGRDPTRGDCSARRREPRASRALLTRKDGAVPP